MSVVLCQLELSAISSAGRITTLLGDTPDGPTTISSTEEFYQHKCNEQEEQYGYANIPDSPGLANKFPELYRLLAPDDYFWLFSENLGFNNDMVDELEDHRHDRY